MKRTIKIEDINMLSVNELELSKVTQITSDNFEFIHFDKLNDGTWRLTYSLKTIPNLRDISSFRIVRED